MKLLENEKIERELQPHPLSFMNLHILWIFLIIWGLFLAWLYHSSYWDGISDKNFLRIGATFGIWLLGLLIFGIVASLLMIRWRIFFAYLAIFAFGVFLFWLGGVMDYADILIPVYTIFIALVFAAIIELYRRSHRYLITNLRLLLKGGMIVKRERSLRYEKIADIEYSQGILGKIFGFGNIIPVTHSGFGLGGDSSFAAGGVEAEGKKTGIFGFVGGAKEVKTPRTRSYYELHGIYPFKEIKNIIEKFVQEATIAPYQREQVMLQREMVDILKELKEKEDEDTS